MTTPNSTSISQPIAPDRALADQVAAFRNTIERDTAGALTITALLSPSLRDRMQGRVAVLRNALRPASSSMADKNRLAKSIAELLSGWMNTGRADPQTTVASYVVHLQDLPAFVVERACHDVAKGYVVGLSPDFPPSAPRLHQLAEEAAAKLRVEMSDIGDVLGAKLRHVPTEGERERVAAGLQALSGKLSEHEDAIAKERRAAAAEEHKAQQRRLFEQHCVAEGISPTSWASPSLLKLLGRMPPKKADEAAA